MTRSHKKGAKRFIRNFEAVARIQHECWHCMHSRYPQQWMVSPIFPGEMYSGDVFVSDDGWEVRKYHYPSCPFDPIEEEFNEELSRDRDMREELPIAA